MSTWRMRLGGAKLGACLAGMLLACASACAQQKVENDFLPEIDVHLEMTPSARLFLQAKDDREGGDPRQATIGPSLLVYHKPLMALKRVIVFDLDTTKSRPVVVEVGYRVITAPAAAIENRMIDAITFNFPLLHQFLIQDRNRADLDWQSGDFTWRYRNRLTLQRTFSIRTYHFAPYVAAEPFYESQYGKWASTDLYAGSIFPVRRRAEINVYYERENDIGKAPNMQKNYLGLQLQLYFSLEEKGKPPQQR